MHGDVPAEIPQGQLVETEADKNEDYSDDNDHVEPDGTEADETDNKSMHRDVPTEIPQGQPDVEKLDDDGRLDLELANRSIHENDADREMQIKNDITETSIQKIVPKDELLNAKDNITPKKEREERKRKSQ